MANTMWSIFLIIFDIGIYARLTGPLNTATIAGDRVIFNCSTDSSSRLRWSRRFFGAPMTDNPQILTRGHKILPTFENEYYTELINTQFNLILLHSTIRNTGRYICLELETSNTASAELTVIEPKPTCNMTDGNIHCDAFYTGLIVPDVDFKTHYVKSVGHLSRRMEKNVSCVISFNEHSVKISNPEPENGVIGSVAKNSPYFVYAAECGTISTLSSSTHPIPITSPTEIAHCNSNNILALLIIIPLIIIIIICVMCKKNKRDVELTERNYTTNDRLSNLLTFNC